MPQNHLHVASGHTCLGLGEASALSVSDTWNMVASRKFSLRQRSGKAVRRKELGAVGRSERRRTECDKRKENPGS